MGAENRAVAEVKLCMDGSLHSIDGARYKKWLNIWINSSFPELRQAVAGGNV